MVRPLVLLGCLPFLARGELRHDALQRELDGLARGFDGRVGVCVQDAAGVSCVRGGERFSLQSVMKLPVAIAALDAADRGAWRLDDAVTVRREHLSLYVQPLAKFVTPQGWRTTLGDLARRAVVDSDSAATDVLIARLGGPSAVHSCLERLGVRGVRIDRDERTLQTETLGIAWRPEFVDPAALDRAIAAIPRGRRTEAYRAYQADPRDTATPRGMAAMLDALARGKLLSPASTRWLLDTMRRTVTFPDRLKAGLAPGWTLGHKTGTSGTWDGVTAATNDVGVITAPDGGSIAVAVFIGDSRAPSRDRAALMAKVSAAIVRRYRASGASSTSSR